MKIGFHLWDPGLWSTEKNSAGGALWMRNLWTYLSDLGHEIIWLGQHYDSIAEPAKGEGLIEECDVIYLYWRWPMHEIYKERNKAYNNQMELIKIAAELGVPMVIGDGDHKMTLDDILYIQKKAKAVLVAPELAPRKDFERLMYPNPYLMVNPLINRMPFFGQGDIVYIGNNYERWDQWLEYIVIPSNEGLRVKCYGNWLEPHPDRRSPQTIKKVAPKVTFPGRLDQSSIIDTYLTADFTVHLAKPSYCKTGFVTMRWAEAASAGTFGFIPAEFRHTPLELRGAVVSSGKDLVTTRRAMTEERWFQVVLAQQKWVTENMKVELWLDMLEEAIRRM